MSVTWFVELAVLGDDASRRFPLPQAQARLWAIESEKALCSGITDDEGHVRFELAGDASSSGLYETLIDDRVFLTIEPGEGVAGAPYSQRALPIIMPAWDCRVLSADDSPGDTARMGPITVPVALRREGAVAPVNAAWYTQRWCELMRGALRKMAETGHAPALRVDGTPVPWVAEAISGLEQVDGVESQHVASANGACFVMKIGDREWVSASVS